MRIDLYTDSPEHADAAIKTLATYGGEVYFHKVPVALKTPVLVWDITTPDAKLCVPVRDESKRYVAYRVEEPAT